MYHKIIRVAILFFTVCFCFCLYSPAFSVRSMDATISASMFVFNIIPKVDANWTVSVLRRDQFNSMHTHSRHIQLQYQKNKNQPRATTNAIFIWKTFLQFWLCWLYKYGRCLVGPFFSLHTQFIPFIALIFENTAQNKCKDHTRCHPFYGIVVKYEIVLSILCRYLSYRILMQLVKLFAHSVVWLVFFL